MKHPWEHIIIAFAADTSVGIERKHPDSPVWKPADIEDVLNIRGETGKHEFRLKPAMRSITLQDGTVLEWPEPMRVAPADGQFHWQTHSGEVRRSNWCGSTYQAELLKTGFCHATEEAAQQHRKALVLANGGEL